jgi:hypothetical protein
MSFQEAALEHARRLARLIDRGGALRLRRLYEAAQAELERKIGHAVGRGSAPFTAHQHRVLLGQVRHGQMVIAQRLGDASAAATVETQRDALDAAIRNIRRGEREFGSGATVTLPIEEAARFQGVLDRRKTSLLKQNRTSMARYGAGLVKRIEGELAVSLATGETTHEATTRVARTADVEFWRAERIVRTEQAWAYNATQRDAITQSAKDLDEELYMRWTELVDDYSHAKLDDRVGDDSVAMHGQVARPGEAFRMPSGAKGVAGSLRDGEWEHPPNRPHDRATLMPWSPAWDEAPPSWQVVGGAKVPVRRQRRRA